MIYTIQKKLRRRILYVEGMTCTSCEKRIDKSLRNIDGIVDVAVYYRSSTVHVTYDIQVTRLSSVIQVIEKLGYDLSSQTKIKKRKKNKVEEDEMGIPKLIGIGVVLLILYSMVQNSGVFDFIPEVNQSMGYGLLFIVGLLTSLHCIAMCGGINLSQCIGDGCNDNSCVQAKLKPSLLYNSGRIISYTIIGGLVGSLGSVVSFSGWGKGIIAVISGTLMVIIALKMLNIFPSLRRVSLTVPGLSNLMSQIDKRKERGPLYVGLLNGFMPCGPLQAMQLYALGTGSFTAGALSMFFFSLGTMPLMFGFGAISTFLSGRFTRKMMKTSAVLVMVLGIIMVSRGLTLSGIATPVFAATQANMAIVQGDIQTVTMSMESRRYTPIIVQKGIPVVWKIEVGPNDLNGCNNPMSIPEYGITKELAPGENIIKFTPDKEGRFSYSCWMGMIKSNIQVVSEPESKSESV